MSEHRRWDPGFFLWALAGFLVSFGFITVVGLPILIVGLILSIWLYRRGPGWPADLGLLAGVGSLCLTIAVFNAISDGLNPTVWAVVGGALVASSSFTFWWLRCRPGAG